MNGLPDLFTMKMPYFRALQVTDLLEQLHLALIDWHKLIIFVEIMSKVVVDFFLKSTKMKLPLSLSGCSNQVK